MKSDVFFELHNHGLPITSTIIFDPLYIPSLYRGTLLASNVSFPACLPPFWPTFSTRFTLLPFLYCGFFVHLAHV